MENKNYLDDYILTYEKANKYLNYLSDYKYNKTRHFTKRTIGKTNFSFPIDSYKIGNGNKHIIIISTTHGCEILTTYFALEIMFSLILDNDLFKEYTAKYTFHFIPILNPEGFIISSSNVFKNISDLNLTSTEKLAKKYLKYYNLDDENAKNKITADKNYKKVLKASLSNISYHKLRKSVSNILASCKLDESVLPIWSANGVGIDPNANSIHKFNEISLERKNNTYGKLRYNDIPNFKPSPIGFPGNLPLSYECPETFFLNKYIQSFIKQKQNLTAIFSYHTTGGEIYSYPEKDKCDDKLYDNYLKVIDCYKKCTGYIPRDETLKYGFMDYYRIKLTSTISMTIELSRKNGNPIGPYSDINKILDEIKANKIALFKTIDYINHLSL